MSDYFIVQSDELYHHGIKGQRWGVRRFQNEDGTLTSKGRARLGFGKAEKRAIGAVVGSAAISGGATAARKMYTDDRFRKASKNYYDKVAPKFHGSGNIFEGTLKIHKDRDFNHELHKQFRDSDKYYKKMSDKMRYAKTYEETKSAEKFMEKMYNSTYHDSIKPAAVNAGKAAVVAVAAVGVGYAGYKAYQHHKQKKEANE